MHDSHEQAFAESLQTIPGQILYLVWMQPTDKNPDNNMLTVIAFSINMTSISFCLDLD